MTFKKIFYSNRFGVAAVGLSRCPNNSLDLCKGSDQGRTPQALPLPERRVQERSVPQGWALYCLILMFLATREELKPIRPLPKFVVVKIIVFASFWQSVAIAILASAGIIKPAVHSHLHAVCSKQSACARSAFLQLQLQLAMWVCE